jgi:hypothetical protein
LGGRFGGPITIPRVYFDQNRSFLFGSYKGLRPTQPQAAQIQYVPDTAIRAAAPFLSSLYSMPSHYRHPVETITDYRRNSFNPTQSYVNVNHTANESRQWNVVDLIHLSAGHHQYTAGIHYRRIKLPTAPDSLWRIDSSAHTREDGHSENTSTASTVMLC